MSKMSSSDDETMVKKIQSLLEEDRGIFLVSTPKDNSQGVVIISNIVNPEDILDPTFNFIVKSGVSAGELTGATLKSLTAVFAKIIEESAIKASKAASESQPRADQEEIDQEILKFIQNNKQTDA